MAETDDSPPNPLVMFPQQFTGDPGLLGVMKWFPGRMRWNAARPDLMPGRQES
jgi:hypothetical protein